MHKSMVIKKNCLSNEAIFCLILRSKKKIPAAKTTQRRMAAAIYRLLMKLVGCKNQKYTAAVMGMDSRNEIIKFFHGTLMNVCFLFPAMDIS